MEPVGQLVQQALVVLEVEQADFHKVLVELLMEQRLVILELLMQQIRVVVVQKDLVVEEVVEATVHLKEEMGDQVLS